MIYPSSIFSPLDSRNSVSKCLLSETVQSKMLIITMREKYKHKIQAFGTNSCPNMKIEKGRNLLITV